MNSKSEFIETLETWRAKLEGAIARGRSSSWILRIWSNFVRTRDLNCCVYCEDAKNVAAHHIFRKSVLPNAQYETGNGITLCASCHLKIHITFNGKPTPEEALNQRGGDDQDYIQSLFHALERDRTARELPLDRYYYLSDWTMAFFKRMQGIEEDFELTGARVAQAHQIWQNPSADYYTALAEIIGAELLRAWDT